jgi:diguanylate cyclase (GGDEF)-like protein
MEMSLPSLTAQGVSRFWLPLVWCCLLGGLLAGSGSAAGATSPLQVGDGADRYEVGPYLEILEDANGQWGIGDVANPAFNAAFSPIHSSTVNRGVSSSTYWVRFSLVQQPNSVSVWSRKVPWLLDIGWPFFDQVDAYMVTSASSHVQSTIVPVPFYEPFRPIGGRYSENQGMLARLPKLSSTEQTIYLRLRPNGVFFLHPVISSVRRYLETSVLRMLWFGLYLGLLLALLLYNLFLYFCLRDRSYLWYVASIAAIGVYFLGVNRLTYEFLFDHPPTTVLRLNFVALAVSLIALVLFVRSFLQTRGRAPRVDCAMRGLLVLLLAVLLQVPFMPMAYLNRCYIAVGGLVPFALITASAVCWCRGYRPARFLVLSWGLYGACGLVYALTFMGWLPFNDATFHSFQIGSALEAIFLSFALADRINLLRQEREQLSHSERRHKELAVTDGLTELYNRRYFEAQIDLEIEGADRLGHKLTLMMLDVDNFKAFNDCYGHQVGDRVLATLGTILLSCVRDKDVACRYGGEEFTIILPGGQNSTAVEIYERINGELAAHRVGSEGRDAGRITMSIGVAEHLPGEPAVNLVHRADQALYEAKARGRNQIVIASREPEAAFFSCFDSPSSSTQPHL